MPSGAIRNHSRHCDGVGSAPRWRKGLAAARRRFDCVAGAQEPLQRGRPATCSVALGVVEHGPAGKAADELVVEGAVLKGVDHVARAGNSSVPEQRAPEIAALRAHEHDPPVDGARGDEVGSPRSLFHWLWYGSNRLTLGT